MRVLAIRGQNLTSLAGEFEVDFEAEPLASAGIFAITGPTGAGKSTLLDAVCLALFNHVPRLVSAARGQVGAAGGETLSADDPRALLRHRAGEGYAEVDFIGLDRGRYRARWYVKRARLRSDGALQQVVQTFTNLETGDVYGGTRTETLTAIRGKIGLTAQQFGRAVMLAQGEFNAFIDADSNTRAELLEKLTGTDLYARLGVAAREKADGLRSVLSEIEVRIAAQNGLDDIQRAEAEERLTKASSDHEAARALMTARERDRNWHARATELAERVQSAEQVRATAELEKAEAAPRRADLASRRLAYSIFPGWRAAIDADAKVAATVLRISALKEESDTARQRAETATVQDTGSADILRLAEQERERQRPQLESARALDRRLAELSEALTPLMEARVAADGEVEASIARHVAAAAKRDEATEGRLALVGWLDRNRSHESLAARRDDLAAGIEEHVELVAKAAGLKSASDALGIRIVDARASLTEAQPTANTAREVLRAAERECETARADLPAPELVTEVELARDRLVGIEPYLLAFERSEADLDRLGSAIETDKVELDRLDGELAASETRRLDIDATLPGLEARHDEAIRAGALSAAVSGDAAEQLRAALVAGEPCPVCGGTDHAVEALAGLIDGRAAADAERISELAREIAAHGSERAVLVDRLQQDSGRRAAAAARIGNGTTAVADAAALRATALTTLEAALQPCGIARNENSQLLRGEVSAQLAAVEDRRRRFTAAREGEQRAVTALDAARAAGVRADDVERAARQAVLDLEAEIGLTDDRLVETERRRDQVGVGLDASLSPHFDWRDDGAAIETLDRIVTAWREQAQALASIDADLPGLTKVAHDADIERGRDALRLEAAIKAERTCLQERDQFAAKRGVIFGGEAVDDVAERLDQAVGAASAERERSRLACERARSDAAAAEARHGQAVRSLDVDQSDATARREALDGELAAKLIDVDLVAAVAAAGEAALEDEAQALAEIDRAVIVADAEWRSRIADRDPRCVAARARSFKTAGTDAA